MKLVSFMRVNSEWEGHRGLARKPFNATGTPRDELTSYSMHVIKLKLKLKLKLKPKAKVELKKEQLCLALLLRR